MKKILIFTLIISLFVTSCESWLDVNTNPNTATLASPDDLFAYAAVSYGANRTGGDSYQPIGFMNQSLATGGSFGWGYGEDRYDVSPYAGTMFLLCRNRLSGSYFALIAASRA